MIASPEQPPNPEEHSNAHSFRLVALAVPAWLAKDSWTGIKYYFGFRFRTALRQTDGGPRVTVNNRDTKGRGLMSPKAYETLAAFLLIICVPVVCDCSAEEPSEPAKTVAVEVKSPAVQADVSPARTRHIPKASELLDFLRKQRVQPKAIVPTGCERVATLGAQCVGEIERTFQSREGFHRDSSPRLVKP